MTMLSRLLHARPLVAFASATAAALIVGGVARATIPSSAREMTLAKLPKA